MNAPLMNSTAPRFIRLAETDRARIDFYIDGFSAHALEGDTLMVAILNNSGHLRESEFGDGHRSGFCMMGACQDCWVWTETGSRLRACGTAVSSGLQIFTRQPEATWFKLA